MAFPPVGTVAPVLGDWQVQYNSVTLGGVGNPYGLIEIDGLDLPPVQTSDLQRARDHGEFVGLDMMGGRDITITGDFVTDGTSLQHAGLVLAESFTQFAEGGSVEIPMWVQLPGLPILCSMARVRKRTVNVDFTYSMGLASYSIALHATDPRLYSNTISTAVSPVGGPVGASVSLSYLGNVDVRPLIKLVGPLTNPTVGNGSTWGITLNRTLHAGEQEIIDLDLHTATFIPSGGPAVFDRGSVAGTSVWPNYSYGINALFNTPTTIGCISGDGGLTGGSTLAVYYANGYLI